MLYSWTGSYSFIQQHIRETDPRTILRDLLPETVLPPDLDDMTLWQIIINISEPPKRKKRKDINTLEDVVRLLHESKRILVLTGAGVCIYSCTVWITMCWSANIVPMFLLLSQSACMLFFFFFVGVSFMWNTRLSLQRWDLCTACCRFSGSPRPSSYVWHWILQTGPKTLFQVC